MKTRFYITTPIYYSNGEPHIGHVYCTIMADIIARNKRLRGFETYFLTGTDEHGQKIKISAQNNKMSPKEYVDKITSMFQSLWKSIGISNNDFIRTTEDRHIKVVQKVFSLMKKKNDIYLGNYKGWYCTHCESFWTNTQVGEKHLCLDCKRLVSEESEKSFFFKCSNYIDQLMNFYKNKPFFCFPKYKLNEMMNTFIKPGLQDLSISRISNDWGIPISEENKKYTIYVWLDALFNYVSALDFLNNGELYQKFWNDNNTEIIHIVGADISRFHCIYWPMFLMSCGLRLPDRIFIHGLFKIKGEKMSKSKKNSINPKLLFERYGIDVVRYFFAKEIHFGYDAEFVPELFINAINNDLSNRLGNLLNRTINMIINYFNGQTPSFNESIRSKTTDLDKEIENKLKITIDNYEKKFDSLMITEAIILVMSLIDLGNKYIDSTKPWELKKNKKIVELSNIMIHLSSILYVAAILLSPILINKSSLILDQIGVPKKLRNYNSIKKNIIIDNLIVKKSDKLLFPKFDIGVELEYIKKKILNC